MGIKSLFSDDNEELYLSLLDSIGVGVLFIDGESRKIIFGNKEIEELTCYLSTELINKKIDKLFVRSDQKKVIDLLSLEPLSDEIILRDNEFLLKRKTGRTSSVSLTVKKIAVQNKIIITVINNEPRKELELELQKAYEQMILNSKFASLAEMAGGVAHEINNPLAIILGFTERLKLLIQKGKLDEKELELIVEKISKATLRASGIIDSLKTLSRNDIEDDFVSVPAEKLIKSALELCREKFKLSDIFFSVEMNNVNARVACNESQVLQVLINLLDNAYDAVLEESDKWVRLSLEVKGQFLLICVEDSGPGIPKGVKDEIMNPFFTTKEVGKGTGLGLSVSKNIANRHYGSLEIDEERDGTCFVLKLPLSLKEAVPYEEESFKENADQEYYAGLDLDEGIVDIQDVITEPIDCKDYHILIVDDEKDITEISKLTLESQGFTVSVANDGIEALKVIKDKKIDILLSDLKMPRMTGDGLVNQLKTVTDRDIKVFFMTGSVNCEYEHFFSKGVEAIFNKPISLNEIVSVIKQSFNPSTRYWKDRPARVNYRQSYDLNYSLSPKSNNVVNMGKGGMFIQIEGDLPKQDELIRFDLHVKEGQNKVNIKGLGLVRWVRENGDKDRPRGIGVEFYSMRRDHAQKLLEILNKTISNSYIPNH